MSRSFGKKNYLDRLYIGRPRNGDSLKLRRIPYQSIIVAIHYNSRLLQSTHRNYIVEYTNHCKNLSFIWFGHELITNNNLDRRILEKLKSLSKLCVVGKNKMT